MFHIQNANLRKSILVAISLMVLSSNGEAKPKLSEIQGLPQPIWPKQIRTGSDAQGNVVVSWLDALSQSEPGGLTISLDKISSNGVPESNATTIARGTYRDVYDLAVKSDGSYLLAWFEGGDYKGILWPQSLKGVLSNNLSSVLDFGVITNNIALSLDVFSFSDGFKVFDTEWQAQPSLSVYDSQGQPSANPPLALPNYAAVTTNTAGDYVMAILSDTTLTWSGICENPTGSTQSKTITLALKKNDDQQVSLSPYNQARTFYFGDGPNPNEKVELSVLGSKVVSNASGEIVLVWLEELATTQLKANGRFVHVVTQTLLAQRFNPDLSEKDAKPFVIASTKNKNQNKCMFGIGVVPRGPFLGDFSIDMDDAGDFVVAYGLNSYINKNDAVMVRQFINANGQLVAGKAMKMPAGNRPETKHPKEKGRILYLYMREPSVVITNALTNEFTVIWHHDYADWFFSKGTATLGGNYSILKAARYSSQ